HLNRCKTGSSARGGAHDAAPPRKPARMKFAEPTGQTERMGRPHPLDPPCRLGVPILDALCFVEDDDIRGENAVDILRVDKDLLVVHDGEKHGIAIGREPLLAWTEHRPGRTTSEAGNLLLPFRP